MAPLALFVLIVGVFQNDDVQQLIEHLGSTSAEEREKAGRELFKLGKAAIPALQRVSESSDIDVFKRAQEVLRKIQLEESQIAFGRIERTIDTARTLSLKYTDECIVTGGKTEWRLTTSGTLCLKEGNKVYISETRDDGRKKSTHLLISDGVKLWALYNGETNPIVGNTPSNLSVLLRTSFTRIALEAVPLQMWLATENPKYTEFDPKKSFQVSGFSPELEDGDARVLTYGYGILSGSPSKVTIKLWYEPKSLKVIKRSSEIVLGPEKRTNLEVFSEFNINQPISDDQFNLPQKK